MGTLVYVIILPHSTKQESLWSGTGPDWGCWQGVLGLEPLRSGVGWMGQILRRMKVGHAVLAR